MKVRVKRVPRSSLPLVSVTLKTASSLRPVFSTLTSSGVIRPAWTIPLKPRRVSTLTGETPSALSQTAGARRRAMSARANRRSRCGRRALVPMDYLHHDRPFDPSPSPPHEVKDSNNGCEEEHGGPDAYVLRR